MIRIVVRSNPLEEGYSYADVEAGPSLTKLLGLKVEGLYVEINGIGIPTASWDETYPIDGDFIVVVVPPKTFGIVEGILAAMSQALIAVGAPGAAAAVTSTATYLGGYGIAMGAVQISFAAIMNQAIVMGMSMAVASLVKPQTPSMKARPPNRFYSLTNGSNSPVPYSVLPKLYGTFRITPPMAGNYYTSIGGSSAQFLHGLVCLGYGPMSFATQDGSRVIVGDPNSVPGAKAIIQSGKNKGDKLDDSNVNIDSQAIWIGNTSLTNFPNITWQIGIADAIMRPENYSQDGKKFLPLYTKDVEEEELAYVMNSSYDDFQRKEAASVYLGNKDYEIIPEQDKETNARVVTTGENPSKVSLDLLFPEGIYARDKLQNYMRNGLSVQVMWSRSGEEDWKKPKITWGTDRKKEGSNSEGVFTELTSDWSDMRTKRVRISFSIKDPDQQVGQRYDVKIFRKSTVIVKHAENYYDDMTWTALRTERDILAWNVRDPYLEVDRNVLLMAFKVKATGNLNGTLDTITVAAQSVLKTVTEVDGEGNPTFEWKGSNNPAWAYADVLQGFQLDKARRTEDSQIDWKKLKEWADWCDHPIDTVNCQDYIKTPPGTSTNPPPAAATQYPITVTVALRFPDGLYAISAGSLQSSGVHLLPEWSRVGSGTWTTLSVFDVSGIWTSAHTSTRSFTIDDPSAPEGTKYLIRLSRYSTWFRRQLSTLETDMAWRTITVSQNGKTLETVSLSAKMNTAIAWSGDVTNDTYGLWVNEPTATRARYEYTTTVGLPAPADTAGTSAASTQSVSAFALSDPVLPPVDGGTPSDPVLPPPSPALPGDPILPPTNPPLPGDPVLPPRFPADDGAIVEYNWYHMDDETLLDRLRAISSTGRASWALLDGKFSVIQDNNFDPVQMFTPRNSKGMEISRGYPKVPDALRVRYVTTSSWTQSEKLVLDDWVYVEKELSLGGTNEIKLVDGFGNILGGIDDRESVIAQGYRPAEIFETLETQGVTDRLVKTVDGKGYYLLADQAFREGRYFLAVAHLRTETYRLQVGIDNLIAQRGDCVYLCHDVLSLGKAFGRILSVDGSDVYLDQPIENEGQPYAIRIRRDDGEVVVYKVTVSEEFENAVTLETADGGIKPGDLYTFGIHEVDTLLCKVVNIEYQTDLSAMLTLVPAAPEIQCADQGFIIDSYAAGIVDDVVTSTSILTPPVLINLTATLDTPVLINAETVGSEVYVNWDAVNIDAKLQDITVYYSSDNWETSATTSFSIAAGQGIIGTFALGSTVKAYAVGVTSAGAVSDPSNSVELAIGTLSLPAPKTFQLYPNNWEVSLIWVQPWDLPPSDPDYMIKPFSYKGTEVYYSYVNDHTAVDDQGNLLIQKLATTDHPYGTHLNLTADVMYYYWIRNIDVSGNGSDFFPTNEDHSGLAGAPTQDVTKYFQLLDDWNNLSGPVYQDLGARLNALEGNGP